MRVFTLALYTLLGIAQDIIEEVMQRSGRSEVDEINKIIAKKRNKYDDEKLVQYLCRQGFSYDEVKRAVEECRA